MPITNYSENLMLIINGLKHRITNFSNKKTRFPPFGILYLCVFLRLNCEAINAVKSKTITK